MIRWIARTTTTKRLPVLLCLGALAAILASQLPKIRVDPSIANLIASHEGGENIGPAFREEFGDSSRTLVLLVEGDDVLTREGLQYVHDLSGAVEEYAWAESSVSLTRMPLPRRVEADVNAGLDDLDDLEEFDEDAPLDEEDDFRPAVIDALIALVEADPDRFPGGFQALGPRLSLELEAAPIVDGDTVTEEDVEELRSALEQTDLLEGRLIARERVISGDETTLEEVGLFQSRSQLLHVLFRDRVAVDDGSRLEL